MTLPFVQTWKMQSDLGRFFHLMHTADLCWKPEGEWRMCCLSSIVGHSGFGETSIPNPYWEKVMRQFTRRKRLRKKNNNLRECTFRSFIFSSSKYYSLNSQHTLCYQTFPRKVQCQASQTFSLRMPMSHNSLTVDTISYMGSFLTFHSNLLRGHGFKCMH